MHCMANVSPDWLQSVLQQKGFECHPIRLLSFNAGTDQVWRQTYLLKAAANRFRCSNILVQLWYRPRSYKIAEDGCSNRSRSIFRSYLSF